MLAGALALVLSQTGGGAAEAAPNGSPGAPSSQQAASGEEVFELYLAVYINGRNTGFVAQFFFHSGSNSLSAMAAELKDVGLKVPFSFTREVYLDQLPGIQYRYIQITQSIEITAVDAALRPTVISAKPKRGYVDPETGVGAVLNYSLSGELRWGASSPRSGLTDLSAALDGWIFSPIGTLTSSGYYQSGDASISQGQFRRLETAFDVDIPRRSLTLTLGDFKTSALSWGRSIRAGGIQFRRNLSLRNDLVPQQLFAFSGSAAVPSTVDVFLENNRAFTTEVEPGPFRVEDLSLPSGYGDAVIRVRSADGLETLRKVSFFAARDLVKSGTLDFSAEVGRAREAFGGESNRYGEDTVYSTSLRYGVNERLTVQAHVEGKPDLQMLGLGFTTTPLQRAETTFIAGTSRYNGQTGRFVYGKFRTQIFGADVNASVLRSEKGFADLAYATGVDYLGEVALASSKSLLEFPRAQEVLSVRFPFSEKRRNLGFSMVHSRRASSDAMIVAASYGQVLGWKKRAIEFYGSRNLRTNETRVSLNLNLSLGKRRHSRIGVSRENSSGFRANAYLSRPISGEVGDYGYILQLEQKESGTQARTHAEYRTRYGKVAVDYNQIGGNSYLRPSLDGSISIAGAQLASGNKIYDSFAIVDVGVADVPVEFQNRIVTTTGPSGKALVTGLSSYRPNRISIDVNSLPEGVTPSATAAEVVPSRRTGVLVNLKADNRPSALVTFHDARGQVLPLGAVAYLNGGKISIPIGYDGQAWLEGLKPVNTVRVEMPGRQCIARFSFKADGTLQPTIDSVECS